MEIYKPLKNYEAFYEVSNLGNVKSLRSGKILSKTPRDNGYVSAMVYTDLKNKKTHKRIDIHILVANTFLDKPESKEKLIVDHINGIKTDNKSENLRWVTYSEN